jgi:hypothetical protein
MYVFGGWDEHKNELCDLWEFRVRTASWTLLPTAGKYAPSPRTGAVLVAQPQRDRLLLFGGCDGKRQFAELAEYRLPARHRGEKDSHRRESHRGGESHRHSHRHSHRSEGGRDKANAGWSVVEMSGVPPTKRSNHAMASHGTGRVLIFGGFDGNGFLGDLSAAVID